MSIIARPTWAEIQTLDDIELKAMFIIKGSQYDDFIWDAITQDADGRYTLGAWRSQLAKDNPSAVNLL